MDFRRLKAIACDYDRTLTTQSLDPVPAALNALSRLRERLGLRVLVASGRPLAFLLDVPALRGSVDAVIAENGGVVHFPSTGETWRAPFPAGDLCRILRHVVRDEDFVVCDAMIDCAAVHEHRVRDALTQAPVPARVERNRDRVMILPPDVDKAAGVQRALGAFELDLCDALCVGDGENDVPMLRQARVGIAVANAVPGLKSTAHHVLSDAGGHGVTVLCETWLRSGTGAHVTAGLSPARANEAP